MADMKPVPLANAIAPHSLPYMPQLDSLRAISVLAVIYCHYVHAAYWPFGVNWGTLGVRCFFVLSGFLITSILLRDIDKSPKFTSVYLAFIARRALRLYPILLVTLLVTAVLDVPHTRETLPWNLFYLTNIYMAAQQTWTDVVGHLWSISVEEQFYLLWPFVLFALPRRYLPKLIVGMIVTCLIFRVVWRDFGPSFVGAEVLTPTAFDALGLGTLLALFRNNRFLIGTVGIVGACLWVGTMMFETVDTLPSHVPTILFYINETGACMVFVWVVKCLADGVPGIPGKIIAFPPIVYIGTISYGAYILHQFSPYLLGLVPISLPIEQYYMVCLVMTLVLAALSWHFLELPVMRSGRRWLKKATDGWVSAPAAPNRKARHDISRINP
jgi:peptidoglycan/LPS O-acetylase OafA/YrhL